MKSFFSLLLLVALIGFVWGESHVLVGTSENFDDTIDGNEFVLVEFYAPWCGHCKKLEPEYEKAAKTLKDEGSKIILMKVDATVESKLAESYGVKGYPTLIFFNSGEPVNFDGDRTAQSIIHWVKKKSGPPSQLFKTVDEVTLFTEKGGVVVGVFTNEESKAFQAFFKVAKEEEDFNFGHRFDDKAKESITLTTEDKDVKTFSVEEKINKKILKEWIQKNGYPLVVELDQKVWQRSSSNRVPLLAVFLDPKDLATVKPIIQQVASKNYGTIVSSWMDGVANAQLVSRWGGSGNVLPTAFLVTYPTENPKIIAWDEDTEKELNAETLTNFIEKGIKGEYRTFQKSEPIPESNDGPVKVVVGKTFEQIVNDPTKDVLLELYAPWCGHCKKLEPIYTELGKKFQGIDSVTIAKIDATNNAYSDDIQIQGFPTILFFPANDKKNYVSYEGSRELDDLVKFVVEKATHKIQFPEDKVDL